jgi:hypothetical protein
MKFATLLRNVKNSQLSLDDSVKNLRFWVKKFFSWHKLGFWVAWGSKRARNRAL